jgi:antitoxin MazE
VRGKTKVRLVRMGNSQGIRIPKWLVDQLGLESELDMVVEEDHIEIRPAKKVRSGWDEQFRLMAERGDDKLTDEWPATEWEEDWEWK